MPLDPADLAQLAQAGEHLPEALRGRLLEQGPAAIPPLMKALEAALRRPTPEPEPQAWEPLHLAALLIELGAVEVIEPLLEVIRNAEEDDGLAELALEQLPSFEGQLLEPVLRALEAHPDDKRFLREMGRLLAASGVKDERVFQVLLELVRRDPESGAMELAEYGDERALEALHQAFADTPIKPGRTIANHVFIELRAAIEELGGELTPAERSKLAQADAPMRRLREAMNRAMEEEEREASGPARKSAEPGRNEPCWCGSGIKYKKCHLGRGQR